MGELKNISTPGSGNGTLKKLPNGLRSEEANEMLGRTPSWIIKWGNFVIIFSIVIFFGLSILIRFPDKVELPILIELFPASFTMEAPRNGIIKSLHLQNNELVEEGGIIVELDDRIGLQSIQQLDTFIAAATKALISERYSGIPSIPSVNFADGELDILYNKIVKDLRNLELVDKLRGDQFENKFLLSQSLNDNIQSMKNYIHNWKSKNLIVSPGNGRILFVQPVYLGGQIQKSTILLKIVPENYKYKGTTGVPPSLIGEIKIGSEFPIILDGFPEGKFGSLLGNVSSISHVPRSETNERSSISYDVTIDFGDSLCTNRGIALPFVGKINGIVSINSENKSILSRLTEKMFSFGEKPE